MVKSLKAVRQVTQRGAFLSTFDPSFAIATASDRIAQAIGAPPQLGPREDVRPEDIAALFKLTQTHARPPEWEVSLRRLAGGESFNPRDVRALEALVYADVDVNNPNITAIMEAEEDIPRAALDPNGLPHEAKAFATATRGALIKTLKQIITDLRSSLRLGEGSKKSQSGKKSGSSRRTASTK